MKNLIKCPVCNNLTIEENYDICHVCFWEYDKFDLDNPELISGCNPSSLAKARLTYKKYGISNLKYINKAVKQPKFITKSNY